MKPILDTSVYGRIANIEVIRSPGADKDSLCLLTERLKFCVLDYDSNTGEGRGTRVCMCTSACVSACAREIDR